MTAGRQSWPPVALITDKVRPAVQSKVFILIRGKGAIGINMSYKPVRYVRYEPKLPCLMREREMRRVPRSPDDVRAACPA